MDLEDSHVSSNKLIFYYSPDETSCRMILLLARILDIELELRDVNVMKLEHRKWNFNKANPQCSVPTLEDNDLILIDSRAILTFLVSAYSCNEQLYPKNPRHRALVDQRLYYDSRILEKRMKTYFYPTIASNEPLDNTKKILLQEAICWLDLHLKGRSWVAGIQFTLADLALGVTISQILAFDYKLGHYPRINEWFQNFRKKLAPFGYEEINQMQADKVAEDFRRKSIFIN